MSTKTARNNPKIIFLFGITLLMLTTIVLYMNAQNISYIKLLHQTSAGLNISNVSTMHSSQSSFQDNTALNFIKSIRNALTNEHVICNPNHYRYMQLLLHELTENEVLKHRPKTTSKNVSDHWDTLQYNQYSKVLKQIRIQIINGSIYVSDQLINVRNDIDGYRTAVVIYLHHLKIKYGKHLPNTDFIWHFHDYKDKDPETYREKNWIFKDGVPYFWSDINIAYNYPQHNLFLFAVSRSYLKYRYYADLCDDERYSKYIINFNGVKDYFEFKNLSNNNFSLLHFANKHINKALFRGNSFRGHGTRRSLFKTLFETDYVYNTITRKYFDVADTATGPHNKNHKYNRNVETSFFMRLTEQLLYKYIIVMDGASVRDSFLYQLQSGSVLLKQLSTFYEWWYYDLIDNFHLIIFDNIMDLIGIVINLVDSMHGDIVDGHTHFGTTKNELQFMLNKNMTKWNEIKLQQITNNGKDFADKYLFNDDAVDCFMIHMIQIYNHYLFDVSSITNKDDKTKMYKIDL